jgi:alpha-L-rhamnosidase
MIRSERNSGAPYWNALSLLLAAALVHLMLPGALAEAAAGMKPAGLRCESLVEPLGIDTLSPVLSWKLQDATWGAKQTAYEVFVSSKPSNSRAPQADVWDSGRVNSSQSAGVTYSGPTLQPMKRYYWRVAVWGKDGSPYPVSDPSWFETGLMDAANWHAKWIGHESIELHNVRNSGAQWISNPEVPGYNTHGDTHHDFRMSFNLVKPVQQAVLFTTGEDTVAAWVNGKQVMQPKPLTPWTHMPWGTYERQDVTGQITHAKNTIAIEVTHYAIPGQSAAVMRTRTPMSMCLFLKYEDGSNEVIASKPPQWKAALNADRAWTDPSFDDASWKSAELYAPQTDSFGAAGPGLPWPTGPVAILRRSFAENKPIASARLYATALGGYKFHLNGAVVGDQILAPGWMDFREHVAYQIYDVTKQIKPGKNAIAAYLAAGWYSAPLMWFRRGNNYGATEPALMAQLRIEHTDGSVDWIATDEGWKADASPITFAEIYDGETLDARLTQPGWDKAEFADAAWKAATIVEPKAPEVIAQYFQPIREERVMTAKSVTSPAPGVYLFDFGQNLSGVPRLHTSGKRGQDVRLRFGEVLNPDGTLYTENLRSAKATDHYILAGTGKAEEFQPEFTYHGFRYIELTGLTAKPDVGAVQAVVFHTDAPFTVKFATGDAMVNQLWSNVLWGQRSNFIGVPTDCPQRDERLGWSADAQVFWRTAAFNMDLTTFSQKYAADLRGTQRGTAMYGIFAPGTFTPNPGYGAAWSDAGVIIPWTGWVQSGNRRIIDENWQGMNDYLETLASENPDNLWRNGFGAAFGDWLTPTITTPEDLLATAYWAYDVTLVKQMAEATGRTADAKRFAAKFEAIKAAFQKAYIRSDGFVGTVDKYPSIPPPSMKPEDASTDPKKIVETQTGYVLALHMDLMPRALRAAAAERLVKKIEENGWLLGTGFLGTPYLLEVLSNTGHSDVAYRLLLNRKYPSWGYLIDHGATTTWERWNGDQMRGDPSMNSYNHYAYGAVAEWLYRHAAGVDTVSSDAGFHTIYLHPHFDGRLDHLDFSYESPYGNITSSWKVTGTTVSWHVVVPPNTTAQLPVADSNGTGFTLDGAPLDHHSKLQALGPGVYVLPAGSYDFKASLPAAPSAEAATRAHRPHVAAGPAGTSQVLGQETAK